MNTTLQHLRALEAAVSRLSTAVDARAALADEIRRSRLRNAQRVVRALRGMGR